MPFQAFFTSKQSLGRLPLQFGRRLLCRSFLRRFLAGDRHEHFLLTACDLAWLLGWLGALCRLCAADALAQRVHQVDDILATGSLFRGDGFELLVSEMYGIRRSAIKCRSNGTKPCLRCTRLAAPCQWRF